MPRSSAQAAEATKARILDETVQQLSTLGAEGTSLAGLARALDMSKPGVVGPFGSREILLRLAFQQAVAVFRAQVRAPALSDQVAPGEHRLRTLIDAWVDYLADGPFRGGCVLISASSDVDGRPGPMRTEVARAAAEWRAFLGGLIDEARAHGHVIEGDTDAIVDLLIGLSMCLNQSVQLLDDTNAPTRARRAMQRAIGIPDR